MTDRDGRRGRRLTGLLSALAVAVGVALVAVGVAAQTSPPAAPASVGQVDPTPEPPPSTSSRPADEDAARPRAVEGGRQIAKDEPPPLPLSPPQRLRIPAIDVDTAVNPIGKNPDGTLAVPQPGPRLDQAAWFDQSPSPGQPGPAILEGHVDTEQGPSVFYDLADLRPGDTIEVTRRDGVTAVFTVDGLRDVKKSRFPTEVVYGAKDLSRPALRLITCSQFDPDAGTHVGNTLVFASLTSVRGR